MTTDTWMSEPEGTASVVFDDGSALVRADCEPDVIAGVLEDLVGVEPEAAARWGRGLAKRGLTLVGPDYPYRVVEGRTMDGGTFMAIAEQFSSTN
jgi:hypothetical protein